MSESTVRINSYPPQSLPLTLPRSYEYLCAFASSWLYFSYVASLLEHTHRYYYNEISGDRQWTRPDPPKGSGGKGPGSTTHDDSDDFGGAASPLDALEKLRREHDAGDGGSDDNNDDVDDIENEEKRQKRSRGRSRDDGGHERNHGRSEENTRSSECSGDGDDSMKSAKVPRKTNAAPRKTGSSSSNSDAYHRGEEDWRAERHVRS